MNEDAGHVQFEFEIEKLETKEANINQLSLDIGDSPFPAEEK